MPTKKPVDALEGDLVTFEWQGVKVTGLVVSRDDERSHPLEVEFAGPKTTGDRLRDAPLRFGSVITHLNVYEVITCFSVVPETAKNSSTEDDS